MSQDGRTPYTLHWDVVTIAKARERTGDARQLLALWPAPMQHDRAFAEAGFTAFAATDAGWDRNTTMVIDRLIDALGRYGTPQLRSVPLKRQWSLLMRLFVSSHDLPLAQQVEQPMRSATLPECLVAVGDAGVSLRTGGGHALWWVELPAADDAAAFVTIVAGGLPVTRTSLRWEQLL